MKEQLNEKELEQVVGGTVIVSEDYMNVGFSTLRETYALKNCSYREARNYIDDLLSDNRSLSNEEFDKLAKEKLQAKGWI